MEKESPDKTSSQGVEALFQDLDAKIDAVFRHQMLMAVYASTPRDYGTGSYVNEIEAHSISFIARRPGLTATELCRLTYRTKGTISTLLSHLEQKGLLTQQINPENRRERILSLTDKGRELYEKHSLYDRKCTMDYLLEAARNCTPEEINGFFKLLRFRSDYFEKVLEEETEKYRKARKK